MRGEVERREDLADEGADRRKGHRPTRAAPLTLQKRVGHGGQHDMAMPPGIAAAFEVIEPGFILEVLVLLLNGPALMREGDQPAERRGRRQVDKEEAGRGRTTDGALREEPH